MVGPSFCVVSLKSKCFGCEFNGRAEKLCFWLMIRVIGRFTELAVSRILKEVIFFSEEHKR